MKGKLSGDLENVTGGYGSPAAQMNQPFSVEFRGSEYSLPYTMPVAVQEDGQFAFTNKLRGPVNFLVGGQRFTKNFTASTNEWNITLVKSLPKRIVNQREVVFHFTHPSRVPPHGTVVVLLRDANPGESFRKPLEIKNGEAKAMVNVNQIISCESSEIIGYWFPPKHGIKVEDLKEPLLVNIPVIRAGAIFVQTLNAEGSPAKSVYSKVIEFQSSPLKNILLGVGDGNPAWSPAEPAGRYVANSLPLQGKYLVASRVGNYIVTSDVITLSDLSPDSNVVLHLKEEKTIEGRVLDALGYAVKGARVILSWNMTNMANYSIGLESVSTDSAGKFSFSNTNPDLKFYGVEVSHDSYVTAHQTINFEQLPAVVRLAMGLKLYGQILDKDSGQPLASKLLWASHESRGGMEYTRTDESGNFEFSTLTRGAYRIEVEGYMGPSGTNYAAGAVGKIVIPVAALRRALNH